MFTKMVLSFQLLIIFALACFQNALAMEGQPSFVLSAEQKELYEKGIEFRNGTVSGYSSDESTEQASNIFLELGKLGFPNAMYNYAAIQYKKEHYESAYEWFGKASKLGLEAAGRSCKRMQEEGKVKKDISLVVGSTRSKSKINPILSAIYGEQQSDLTHRHTFNGATTFDLKNSEIPELPHLVGDCRNYDFSKYNIKSVLLEKMPTLDAAYMGSIKEPSGDTVKIYGENYLGDCIANIAKSMAFDSVIEIEWAPSIALLNIKDSVIDELTAKNPFNGFLDLNVALQSIFIGMGNTKNVHLLPTDIAERSLVQSKRVGNLLAFYHSHISEFSLATLKKQLYLEAITIQKMLNMGSLVFFETGPGEDVEKFQANYHKAIYLKLDKFDPKLLKHKIEFRGKIGRMYDSCTFLESSFVNFLLEDLCAEANFPYVANFMKSLGFSEVSIERTTNAHTNRKNVWMIRGTRSNKSDQIAVSRECPICMDMQTNFLKCHSCKQAWCRICASKWLNNEFSYTTNYIDPSLTHVHTATNKACPFCKHQFTEEQLWQVKTNY